MHKQLSWNPELKGEQYCAPACGRGCTVVEYEQAVLLGDTLLLRMEGPGWEVRVWENLGWHYSVTNGWATVYPSVDGDFHCLLSEVKGEGCGSSLWSDGVFNSDPNECVRRQYILAQNKIKQLIVASYSYLNP